MFGPSGSRTPPSWPRHRARSDSLLHPAHDLRLRRDRQVAGARPVRAGGEGGSLSVNATTASPPSRRTGARLLQVASGPSVPDAGGFEVFQGVEQALLLEVEGVVVGQRTGVHARRLEDLDGQRVGAEVEDLGGADHGRPWTVMAHSRLMRRRSAERSSGSTSPHGSAGRAALSASFTPRPSITSPVSASVAILIERIEAPRPLCRRPSPAVAPTAAGRRAYRGEPGDLLIHCLSADCLGGSVEHARAPFPAPGQLNRGTPSSS